jgi:hypothetical protein
VFLRFHHAEFVTDPLLRAYVGGNRDLEEPLIKSMIRAGLLLGEVYVAVDDFGKILAVAVWSPPGDLLFSKFALFTRLKECLLIGYFSEEQRALGLNDVFAQLSKGAVEWWNSIVRVFLYFGALTSRTFISVSWRPGRIPRRTLWPDGIYSH